MASIASKDKHIMDLQNQAKYKQHILKKNYQEMLKNVTNNPFLQTAIDSYTAYFFKEAGTKQQQIAALQKLLNAGGLDEHDRWELQREIKALEKLLKK